MITHKSDVMTLPSILTLALPKSTHIINKTIHSIQNAAHGQLGCKFGICGHGWGGGICRTVYSSLGTEGASQANNNPLSDCNNDKNNKDASSSDCKNQSTDGSRNGSSGNSVNNKINNNNDNNQNKRQQPNPVPEDNTHPCNHCSSELKTTRLMEIYYLNS